MQELQQEIEEILRTVPPETVGARLARARKRLGLSIRDLAAAAQVNKNSILRLERGMPPLPLTVIKLCTAMGLHAATVIRPASAEEEPVAVHRKEDDRWYDMTEFGTPLADRPLAPDDRRRLAQEGVPAPMLLLRSRLETGQLLPNVIELYGESPTRRHMGEEMVYVLSGSLTLTVGERRFDLTEGEAATFWSSEEHSYAPAPGASLPVRILSVSLLHRPGTKA